MAKSRFKTKLSKAQRRKNVLVFLTVIVCSYAFALLFSYYVMEIDWTTGLDTEALLEVFALISAFVFFVFSMLLFPVLLAAIALGLQKGKAKRVHDDSTFVPIQKIDYYRDNLSELTPCLVSLLIDLDIYGKKDIVATLLRMKNKNVISFQENGGIIVTAKNMRELDGGEIELLNILKNNQMNNKSALTVWKQNRFREAEQLGYIQKKTVDKKKNYIYLCVALLSVFVVLILWGTFLANDIYNYIGLSFVFLFVIDILMFVPWYLAIREATYCKRGDILWERTPIGNEMAEKISGLGRFINEFSRLSEAKKEEVVLWDDYLVYAIVLEENEQIVKDISRLYNFNLRRFDRLRLFDT